MFIQTEDTPNPATMKFLPSRAVVDAPVDFDTPEAAIISPLAQALFNIEGVSRVFLGTDFISVTRDEAADWPVLRPAILATIMDHFTLGKPVLSDEAKNAVPDNQLDPAAALSAEDAEIVARITELLDLRIRPAVAQDGGDVAFERYEEGVVYLRLKGACAGCPSATATLKFGIEQMLRHFIPEVQEVRRVG